MDDALTAQADTVAPFLARLWPSVRDQARELVTPLAPAIGEVLMLGCGDSYHAARATEMAFGEWAGCRARAATAMDAARYMIPRRSCEWKRTLVIGISASGEVARTREALDLAADAGAFTLAVTSTRGSSLTTSAKLSLVADTPPTPGAPGLLSFVASLTMTFATCAALAEPDTAAEMDRFLTKLPELLSPWVVSERRRGIELADVTSGTQPVLYLGAGPAYGLALFGAAKLVEAAGECAWGEDVEEWAHIAYFAEPANTPLWLLTSGGRSASREEEVAHAALAIGRRLEVSRWEADSSFSPLAREALSPLALWAGPVAYASRRSLLIGENPFRGFGGGRSRDEGGGASRIRSSRRLTKTRELQTGD